MLWPVDRFGRQGFFVAVLIVPTTQPETI